jgi:hypothetical protein
MSDRMSCRRRGRSSWFLRWNRRGLGIDRVHRIAPHQLWQKLPERGGVIEQVEPDDAFADGEQRADWPGSGAQPTTYASIDVA